MAPFPQADHAIPEDPAVEVGESAAAFLLSL
jgi:hypothetical protein